MAHIVDLHETGHVLVAGPLSGHAAGELRGLAILNVGVEQALRLKQGDPAVRAGRYTVTAMPWMVPTGAMAFAPARFPRSMAGAEAD